MVRGLITPILLDDSELEQARYESEQSFVAHRDVEGTARYLNLYEEVRQATDRAFAATDDLQLVTGEALVSDPEIWHILRYCCAPPISEEDLWTVVGKKFKRVPVAFAPATATALSTRFDPTRFPWVSANRPPTADERDRAAMATAVLLAATRLSTARRGSASTAQEAAVAKLLSEAGFVLDQSRTEIGFPDDLPRQTFSSERKVGGSKCDVPVRLKDGRLLAIECKVSNGPKNGWKRLHREIGGKARDWRDQFGTQVVTCAVIGGSFDLSCLKRTQADFDVFVVFDHQLDRLGQFLRRVG